MLSTASWHGLIEILRWDAFMQKDGMTSSKRTICRFRRERIRGDFPFSHPQWQFILPESEHLQQIKSYWRRKSNISLRTAIIPAEIYGDSGATTGSTVNWDVPHMASDLPPCGKNTDITPAPLRILTVDSDYNFSLGGISYFAIWMTKYLVDLLYTYNFVSLVVMNVRFEIESQKFFFVQ